jgi:hypothetical protein
MKVPDHELWQAVIDAEITALTDNEMEGCEAP